MFTVELSAIGRSTRRWVACMTFAAAVAAGLLASVSMASTKETWQPIQAGCYEASLHEAIDSWRDFPASVSSFRLAGYNGKGLVTFVALDPGINRGLKSDSTPVFIGASGNLQSTCVVRLPLKDCEPAATSIARLKQLTVPIGYGYDESLVIRLHGPSHALFAIDGQGNKNDFRYDSPHPVSEAIAAEIESLRGCWQGAEDLLRERHPTMR